MDEARFAELVLSGVDYPRCTVSLREEVPDCNHHSRLLREGTWFCRCCADAQNRRNPSYADEYDCDGAKL